MERIVDRDIIFLGVAFNKSDDWNGDIFVSSLTLYS